MKNLQMQVVLQVRNAGRNKETSTRRKRMAFRAYNEGAGTGADEIQLILSVRSLIVDPGGSEQLNEH